MSTEKGIKTIYEEYESLMKDMAAGKPVPEHTLAILDTIIYDAEIMLEKQLGTDGRRQILEAKLRGGTREVIRMIEQLVEPMSYDHYRDRTTG